MSDYHLEALSVDLPRKSPLAFLRRASAADAKSISDGEQEALAEQEEEMDDHQQEALSTDLPEDNLQLALRRASAADAKSLSGEDQGLAAGLKQKARTTQAIRTAAYRDAINVVAREMQRRGQNLTCWTERDAEAAREIAEILIGLHSQGVTASDPAFAR